MPRKSKEELSQDFMKESLIDQEAIKRAKESLEELEYITNEDILQDDGKMTSNTQTSRNGWKLNIIHKQNDCDHEIRQEIKNEYIKVVFCENCFKIINWEITGTAYTADVKLPNRSNLELCFRLFSLINIGIIWITLLFLWLK